MPNIIPYDPGNLAIRPSETGVESFAAAGRRAGAFYNQAGEALARTGAEIGRGVAAAGDVAAEYMAHQELTAGTATGTQLQEKQLEDKDNAIKSIDPQDPLYAHKVELAVKQWRDQSDQEWQEWASGFNTQKGTDWAQAHIARVRESNFVHSAADIATAAKIGFDNSTHTMVNTASNIAFKDPAQLQTQLDLLDHNTKALVDSSPLKGVDAAKAMTEVNEKAKEGIIKSAIQGAILKGGGWEKIANDPRYSPYVNGAETKMFERAARTYDRMAASEARTARVQQDYINKQNFNEAANKLEVETIPQKPGDPPVLPNDYWDRVKQIGVMPGVDPSRLRSLISNGEHITDKLGKPEPTEGVSHAATVQAINDMRAGKPVDVDALYGTEQLRNNDYTLLKNAIQQRATPDGERLDKDRDLFFKRYSMMIDPSMGEHGDRLYTAEMDARQAERDAIAKGNDPHSVYDPKSPNFIGTPAQINKWKQPLQAQITPQAATAPERPKGFPTDAQWDAARKFWFVMQDGKKFRVEANTGQPAWPTIPLSQ